MAIECRREDDEKKEETTGINLVAYLTNENKANVNNVVFVILIIRIENNGSCCGTNEGQISYISFLKPIRKSI